MNENKSLLEEFKDVVTVNPGRTILVKLHPGLRMIYTIQKEYSSIPAQMREMVKQDIKKLWISGS